MQDKKNHEQCVKLVFVKLPVGVGAFCKFNSKVEYHIIDWRELAKYKVEVGVSLGSKYFMDDNKPTLRAIFKAKSEFK